MADSVKIRIDGDDSGFRKELQQSEKSAAAAAAAMAAEFRKSGMQQSEAFRRAWEEIKSAQSRGATVVINNVETIIRANKDLERSTKSISTKGYDALAASADDMRRDVTNDLAAIRTQTERMSDGFHRAGNVLKTAFTGIAVVAAVRSVAQTFYEAAKAGVTYNADIEQLKTSFEVMTGSAKEAAAVVERLRKLGASTPYDFAGLATTTQTLMQYNLTADEAIRVTEMIGDIAQGSADKMSRISMAYGQMASSGKVSLEDVKQMIEAGFNPLLVISEKTGESMESLYDRISKGTLTVEELTDAMVAATSEGGMFFESMEKQSQTLNGQLSTLKDNLQTFGGTVFAGISESLTTTVLPAANALIEELNAAYERNGVDGLLRVIERKIPQLVSKATEIAKTVFAQVGKRIPSMVNGVFQNLPATLESFFEILTTLSDTLFDTLSVIVTNLVERFPEYAPVILRGIVNLAMSIVKGSFGVIQSAWRSIFGGPAEYELGRAVDRMFENVDWQRVETMSATISADVDTSGATANIETAVQEIITALGGFDIDESKITELIGQDYQTIYNALLSFGLPKEAAEEIATRVTDVNKMIQDQLSAVGIALPVETIYRLYRESNENRQILYDRLRDMGLTEVQILAVAGILNASTGSLADKIVSVADAVKTALTDGEADTEEVIGELVGMVETVTGEAEASIDNWEKAQIEMLDPNAENYAEAVASIIAEADRMRQELSMSEIKALEFIRSMAGMSTAEVNAHLGEFDAIIGKMLEVMGFIEEATDMANSAAANAYKTVTAGLESDEETVALAVQFVWQAHQTSSDEITAVRDAALEEARARFAATGDEEEFLTAKAQIELQYETDMAANDAQYESALTSIFQGVAKSLPDDVSEPLIEAAESLDVANQVNAIIERALADENYDFSDVSPVVARAFDDMFGEGTFDEALENGTMRLNIPLFERLADEYINSAAEILETVDAGVLGVTMATVIGEGFANGTAYENLDMAEALPMLFSDAIDHSVETIEAGEPEITSAAETATSGIATIADIRDQLEVIGSDAIQGMIDGILSRKDDVDSAVAFVAGGVPRMTARVMEIKSPSRVMKRLGEFVGQGYEIGVVESLRQAVSRAENIVGSMNLTTKPLTAPDMSGAFGVAAQDIADAEAGRPVVLSIDGKELGMVMTPYTRTAQNSYNYSIALGVGK